jgi:UDP-N-acetylmuramoylalanine--D-glutamate ligase
VGLARSGAAAARVLSERGERVIGVDAGAPPGVEALAARGVELHLRDDGIAQLERVEAVVKSPGVPAQAPVIAAARAGGLPVLGELELAWRLLPNEIIAVTGTNGKTTTVELIGHIHREAGLPVAVAGNVGAALSGLVGELEEHATIVCETSSFQLEDALAFAPEAAVLLNITPDHLDRHGTLEAYREAKLRIFAHQGAGDVAVLPAELAEIPLRSGVRRVRFGIHPDTDTRADANTDAFADADTCADANTDAFADADTCADAHTDAFADADTRADAHTDAFADTDTGAECALRDGRLWWEGEPLLQATELSLRGAHNLQNALAAAAVCLARGVDRDAVRAGLRSFAGVPHRLQEVASPGGVSYVNDSKATNVASTLVALRAFPEGGIHLILGGQGKNQDFAPLREPVAASCRAVYLIGEDAPRIAAALEGVTALAGATVPLHECGELERAVAGASAAAGAGETVLLSPACASFDQFADFEARGERFSQLVREGIV